ncbi:MAG: MerR family transcriptional regulator [Bacteroidetes bacterium]|nr:MerR family transcriptional regulator [Bacteroidota bacterium]
MPVNEKEETEKLYYSISEVSELFDLNASTIRFWEKEFEMLSPTKNKKGNRLFTKKDIDHLAQIVELVKQKGFTIQGAKEQLKNKPSLKKGSNNDEVIAKLKEIKDKLIKLGNNEA